MMKQTWWCMFFVTALALLGASGASADWVPIDSSVVLVEKGEPVPGRDETGAATVTYEVVATNITSGNIEGYIRIFVEPTAGTADPVNPDGSTDTEGTDPRVYYEVDSAQEALLEGGESVTISMIFAAVYNDNVLVEPLFDLSVELNDASIDNSIFRKKISKTPEYYSGEGKLVVMPRYVPAKDTKGQLLFKDPSTDGFVPCTDEDNDGIVDCPKNDFSSGTITQVKPIVTIYVQEVESTEFNNVPDYDPNGERLAHDIYAAVSYDEGATWKRQNISRTSEKSSYVLENGVSYPGDSESADVVVAGDQVLVTWVDKYCRSGNPWGFVDESEDIYQNMGPQRSVDYMDVKGDEDPRPDLGERPFSCVWACRGILQDDGTIVWYKGEQITTGRRDAIRNFTAGIEADNASPPDKTFAPGGFAISWQEDPKGLKTGKGRGPGAGMSGACVNHKTDIWYTYIDYGETFAAVDEEFVSNDGSGDAVPSPSEDGGYTPYTCLCGYVYDPYEVNPENPVKFTELPTDWTCPMCELGTENFEKNTRPHALNLFAAPVRITDNAVCREREVEEVMGYTHTDDHIAVTDCTYSYEGETTSNPLTWDQLGDEWVCPRCGGGKETFKDAPEFIKYRKEGGPYCQQFAGNPRVNKKGEIVEPGQEGYEYAFYTYSYVDANNNEILVPLDGDTGASRPNISLVNWQGQTLAVMAYEETKGIGIGSDKVAAAMEQKAPFPLVVVSEDPLNLQGGFVNSDCRSCHYHNTVPKDRFVPIGNAITCEEKGGIWKPEMDAYYPYEGYPYITGNPVQITDPNASNYVTWNEENWTPCVKFEGGREIYPRDWAPTDKTAYDAYFVLPEKLPGWHAEMMDCTGCHVPFGTKEVSEAVDEDAEPRYRHGKNIYYHSFAYNAPDAVNHGHIINLPNAYGWVAEGTDDIYENARRVRVVPNPMYKEPEVDPETGEVIASDGSNVTLGLLFKQGKDGQGAPADAFLRLFRNGFDIQHLDDGALNLSSSTPYLFQNPEDVGNEEGGANLAGDGTGDLIGNHNTPKIDHFYWTDANLHDPSGFWFKDETGERLWEESFYTTGVEVPTIRANPFENVFSTRLSIRGNFIVAGFAYCTNWAAAKKAKDHYDFYVRTSEDGGATWSLPVNVSQLKNNTESVSDCRIIQPPPTLFPPGADESNYTNPEFRAIPRHDFYDHNSYFVAIGTKENTPQPAPNVLELEEGEIFLDAFYTRTQDRGKSYETVTKSTPNPKYDPSVDPNYKWIDNMTGEMTDQERDANDIANAQNLAVMEYLEEFDWLAQGDANQGDVQVACNPNGTLLHTIWEQEMALDDSESQTHFQGTDLWYRKITYLTPESEVQGDVNLDGELTWDDGVVILKKLGTTALDPDFVWEADLRQDNEITFKDFRAWRGIYRDSILSNLRWRWLTK